jgi:hypothetical protein
MTTPADGRTCSGAYAMLTLARFFWRTRSDGAAVFLAPVALFAWALLGSAL